LEALIVIPPLPHPPLTVENATNPAYQEVANRCRKSEYFLLGFDFWIHQFSQEGVEVVEEEGQLRWAKEWYGRNLTLTVVERDTLFFELEMNPDGFYIEGWTVPWGKAAYIKWPHEYLKWDKRPDGLEFTMLSVGISRYHSFHSPTKGGWMSINDIVRCICFFKAHWDAHGHGYYTTGGYTGEW
jgi:hypothetical protein